MVSSRDIWRRSQNLLSQAGAARNLGSTLRKGIGGTLLAGSSVVIGTVLAAGETVIQPLTAFAGSLADLTVALFGSPARIVIAGADATAASLTGIFNVGPLTFMLGIGSVLGGLWLIGRYLDEEETGNIIPGSPVDIPFFGESEEASDD